MAMRDFRQYLRSPCLFVYFGRTGSNVMVANYEDKANKGRAVSNGLMQPFYTGIREMTRRRTKTTASTKVLHWKALKVCSFINRTAHKFVVGRCFYYGACYRLTITLLHTDTRAVRYMCGWLVSLAEGKST